MARVIFLEIALFEFSSNSISTDIVLLLFRFVEHALEVAIVFGWVLLLLLFRGSLRLLLHLLGSSSCFLLRRSLCERILGCRGSWLHSGGIVTRLNSLSVSFTIWISQGLHFCVVGWHVKIHAGLLVLNAAWLIHISYNIFLMLLVASLMVVLRVRKISSSEMTRSESGVASIWLVLFLTFMMGALHGLEAVTSTVEPFDLRIILVVVHWVDKLWVEFLILLVVELIWKSAMGAAQSSQWLF